MEKIKALLRCEAGPEWSRRKKAYYYAYRLIAVILASFAMGTALLLLAYGGYPGAVLGDYFHFFPLIVLNALPVALLSLLLYGALGRAWCSLLLSGGAATALSVINFYKLYFRDQPLYFEDLLLFREATNMVSSGYALFLSKRVLLTVGVLLLLTLLLYFLAPGALRPWRIRVGTAGTALVLAIALVPAFSSQELYDSIENYEHLERWRPAENYISKGFLYPFLHSVWDVVDAPLPGYTVKRAEDLLSAYSDADIPDDRKISVIAIMREAYVDFSRFDIPGLDNSLYDPYHALEAESYVGDMASNTFAGGTIDAERCFLTGNYTLRNFRSDTNSYVWYLRQQGYTTEGCHPYYGWFYDREVANPLLGFAHYRFWEDDFQHLCSYHFVPDVVLIPEIYSDFLKNKSAGTPYFSFSVTTQAHGPYPTDRPAPSEYLTGSYSEGCLNAANWYLHYTAGIDQELVKLVEQLRADPEPVVLITFGDHMPWMGYSNAFYDELGVDLQVTETNDPYCTRYLIWANDAAKQVLGHDVRGEGPTVSPCYLMNLLFRQLDWEGPAFLQAMDDMMEVFPVVHTFDPACYVVDGAFTTQIPPERQDLFRDFLYLQKYWRTKFLF